MSSELDCGADPGLAYPSVYKRGKNAEIHPKLVFGWSPACEVTGVAHWCAHPPNCERLTAGVSCAGWASCDTALTTVQILSAALELRFGFRGLVWTKPRAHLRLNAAVLSCG
jgi:hypothetical protein